MRWQRSVNRALKRVSLTHTQLLALSALDVAQRRASEAVTQATVAGEAGLDPVTTSAVLRALEERGYVSRDVGHTDKRSWRVCVTPQGERTLEGAARLVEAAGAKDARPPRRSRA